MRKLFNKALTLALITTTLLSTSCKQDKDICTSSKTSSISFGFVVNNESLNKERGGYRLEGKSIINPVAAIVNLSDEHGNELIKNKRLTFHKNGDNHITSDLEVAPGNYVVTNYLLVDENDKVIAANLKGEDNKITISVDEFKNTESVIIPEVVSTEVMPVATNNLKATTGFEMITIDVNYENNALEGEIKFDLSCYENADDVLFFWGDGSEPEVAKGPHSAFRFKNIYHTFASSGKYYLMIYGDLSSIYTMLINSNTEFTDANFSGGINIYDLRINVNKIVNIDLSGLPNLSYLWTNGNQLTSLDLSKNTLLKEIYVQDNNLSSLNIKNCPKVNKLIAYNNQLTSIETSFHPEVNDMAIHNNKLTHFNAAAFPNTPIINLNNNKLTTPDFSKNLELLALGCDNNNITNIVLPENGKFRLLSINENNDLKDLDISKTPELISIDISKTKITSLDITNNKKLKQIEWNSDALQAEDMNNLYTQFFIHASVNNILEGELTTSKVEPSSPRAIMFKQQLETTYKWTITQE